MAVVCQTCGDEGFIEALVYCDSCKIGAVHRYCCGITPVPIDDYVIWFCSDCDESDTGSDCKEVEHHDTGNVEPAEVFSSPPVIETMKEPERRQISGSHERTSLLGNEASVSKNSQKRKSINHSLPDATNFETVEVSKMRVGSETGNEISILEKSEKKKKTNMEEEKNEEHNQISPVLEAEDTTSVKPMNQSKKRKCSDSRESKELNSLVRNDVSVFKKKMSNDESSNHTSPVLEAEGHGLQNTTSVEAMMQSSKGNSKESEELNVFVRNEVSVLEKSGKKKMSSNHTSLVRKAVDHGLQDTTIAESMKESKKQKTSDSRESRELNDLVRNKVSVLKKSEKKKKMKEEKSKNEESSNHTAPGLAAKDHVAKVPESSASRKPYESAGLAKNGASGNSSNVPDYNPCITSKKRRLSPGNIRVTNENTELAAKNSSWKESESKMLQTNEVMTATNLDYPALNNDRAQPIYVPIWRGSMYVKQGNMCSIDGLVAHLSNLACAKVYEKASSLHTRLSAEMFPRLEIWPESFLKNGPPTDESIALYFFPSRDSNGEKVYYSLVLEMKKNDLAMKCLLDDVELLLFTSYQLPLSCWKFHSKEYLWGIFRRRKISRH